MPSSIFIVRAFVKLREALATNRALTQRIEKLAATQNDHAALFEIVIRDVQDLDSRLKAPKRQKARVGFHVPE